MGRTECEMWKHHKNIIYITMYNLTLQAMTSILALQEIHPEMVGDNWDYLSMYLQGLTGGLVVKTVLLLQGTWVRFLGN